MIWYFVIYVVCVGGFFFFTGRELTIRTWIPSDKDKDWTLRVGDPFLCALVFPFALYFIFLCWICEHARRHALITRNVINHWRKRK